MGDPVVDLRASVAPYACVRGPDPIEGGASAVIRVGADTEVTVELTATGRATASAASPDAAPLYVDLELDALGAVRVRSSDAGFAAALVLGLDGRLRRALAVGGSARLGFGRWQLVRPRVTVTVRELAETVALLAARPAAIARDWSAAARALDASWSGRWSPRGDAGFRVATERGAVELTHRLHDDRLRTEAVLVASGAIASQPGVVLDPHELAALIERLVGTAPNVRSAAAAPDRIVASIGFDDWPSRRLAIAPAAPRVWTVRPTAGRDPARGLDEELTIDGVAVRTWCDDATTRVRAAAPGADGLAIEARPGYRFLRGWLWPDPQLGDRAFDDRYLIEADDLPWARWWLGATERAAIAATFAPEAAHPFAFALANAAVEFHAVALPSRHVVDAARQAAAFLAARGDRATAEWRDLAAPLGATVVGDRFGRDGGLALRTGRGAIAIELRPIVGSDGRLATRAEVIGRGADGDGPHLAVRVDRAPDRLEPARGRRDPAIRAPSGYDARASDPAWAAARLEAIGPTLAIAQPTLVELTGERASITWSGPILDVPRLIAGVELLARAVRAGPTAAAPYR